MEIFFGLAYLAVIISLLYRYVDSSESSAAKDKINHRSISENIDHINELDEKLQRVEELITDISVCSPQVHQKAISFEWTSTSGKKKQYDIWIDGKCRNTKDILRFAYSERDRLRTSLQHETKKLSEMCGKSMEKKTI